MEQPEQAGVDAQAPVAEAPVQAEAPAAAVEEPQNPQGSQEEIPEELPAEPEKQREAFIKLRQENKRLKQLEAQGQMVEEEQSVLEQFRGGHYQAPQEPMTPEMDLNVITQRMTQAERMATNSAMETAEIRKELEDQKLYAEFPELNPKNPESRKPENKALDEFIAGQYILAQLSGKRPDVVQIARNAKSKFEALSNAQKQQIASETVEQIQKKEHATIEARGSNINIPQGEDLEDVRHKTRRGDPDATAELIKKSGII